MTILSAEARKRSSPTWRWQCCQTAAEAAPTGRVRDTRAEMPHIDEPTQERMREIFRDFPADSDLKYGTVDPKASKPVMYSAQFSRG